MGFFDWFSGLFSSKSDEENKGNEGNIERDVSKRGEGLQNVYEKNEALPDQVQGDLKAQDEHETVVAQEAESEEQGIAEVNVQQDKDETQELSLSH